MRALGGASAAAGLIRALALRTTQFVALFELTLLVAARSFGRRAQGARLAGARLRLRIIKQVGRDVSRIAAVVCTTLFLVVTCSESERLVR